MPDASAYPARYNYFHLTTTGSLATEPTPGPTVRRASPNVVWGAEGYRGAPPLRARKLVLPRHDARFHLLHDRADGFGRAGEVEYRKAWFLPAPPFWERIAIVFMRTVSHAHMITW